MQELRLARVVAHCGSSSDLRERLRLVRVVAHGGHSRCKNYKLREKEIETEIAERSRVEIGVDMW